MKKVIFCITMLVMFILVMVATPAKSLEYNYPLDEGMDKLLAAMLSLVVSLWGAVTTKVKQLFLAIGLAGIMLYIFGIAAMLSSLGMYFIAVLWVGEYPELKESITKPFKEEGK